MAPLDCRIGGGIRVAVLYFTPESRSGRECCFRGRRWLLQEERGVSMYRRFLREVASAGLPARPAETIDISQPAFLPEPAQRYLQFMKVADRTPEW